MVGKRKIDKIENIIFPDIRYAKKCKKEYIQKLIKFYDWFMEVNKIFLKIEKEKRKK